MIRVAIYARYSSDLQTDASIDDQIRVTEERAKREGWKVVNRYTDHGISGASIIRRPGIQMLIQDAAAGKFDIVLAEAMDRLSRDQEDIAGIYKRMLFSGIKIITLSEGEINEMHIGLKGTMNALFLKDLADKTRRGMRGKIEGGMSGGGITYGYDVVKKFDARGEPVRGERTINLEQAAIVKRIFKEYVQGKSPRAIAHQLNKEGVPGPNSGSWGPSTIYGNRDRGIGILNNELYIGRLVWNRQRFIKDPDTGKRVARLNPPEQWITKEVPELRILDEALWEQAKEKQGSIRKLGVEFWDRRRPKFLFSNIIECACCGGGVGMVSKHSYGCSTSRNKGTCDNRLTIRRDALEQAVLDSLKNHLMSPELIEVYCEEYARYMNELRMNMNAERAGMEAELKKRRRDDGKFVQAILDGFASPQLKDKVNANTARIEALEVLLADKPEAPVLLHPHMGKHYRNEVAELLRHLSDSEHRHKASDVVRGLIEKIVLTPNEEKTELLVDLHGDLAGILGMASGRAKPLKENDELVQQVKMVAGARFELTTFRL